VNYTDVKAPKAGCKPKFDINSKSHISDWLTVMLFQVQQRCWSRNKLCYRWNHIHPQL